MLALLALSYSTAPFPLVPHQLKFIGGLDMVTIAPVLIGKPLLLLLGFPAEIQLLNTEPDSTF